MIELITKQLWLSSISAQVFANRRTKNKSYSGGIQERKNVNPCKCTVIVSYFIYLFIFQLRAVLVGVSSKFVR